MAHPPDQLMATRFEVSSVTSSSRGPHPPCCKSCSALPSEQAAGLSWSCQPQACPARPSLGQALMPATATDAYSGFSAGRPTTASHVLGPTSPLTRGFPQIRAADVVVVVSGGDGAVPSVVAGLISSPVIAVPTSVGYGASLGGISSLLSSLTAASPGELLHTLLCACFIRAVHHESSLI